MKNKYFITLLALIFISFSVKASKRIEDNPTLKGKHSIAVSLVNFNYAIMYMWSDMTSPVFRNYLNNVIYSYGITEKTNFRSSFMFSYKNRGVESKHRYYEWEKLKFRSGELRVGLERNFGKKRLSGFYGIDTRVEYGKSHHEYCYECGERYFIYRPPYKGEFVNTKLEIGFVPFVGAKFRLSNSMFLMTELAISFNRIFEYEGNNISAHNYMMPFTTRILSVGYTF